MPDRDDPRDPAGQQRPVPSPGPGRVVRILQLGPQDALDLTNLDPRQAEVLEAKAVEKAIDRDDRRQRLRDDLQVTAAQLGVYATHVEAATAQGASATITNTKDDSLGRTEMILGNSAAAQAGKLSRSQQGFGDDSRLWLLLSVIAGVVVVLVAALRR